MLLSTLHREWDSFLSLSAVNSGYDQGEHCLSAVQSVPYHVNLLARIVFENICFPFFLHKLTSFFTLNGRKKTPAGPSKQGGAKFVSRREVTNVGVVVIWSFTSKLFGVVTKCRLNFPSIIKLIFSFSNKCREKQYDQRQYWQNSPRKLTVLIFLACHWWTIIDNLEDLSLSCHIK